MRYQNRYMDAKQVKVLPIIISKDSLITMNISCVTNEDHARLDSMTYLSAERCAPCQQPTEKVYLSV